MRKIFVALGVAMASFVGLMHVEEVTAADVFSSTKDTPAHVLPSEVQSWTALWAAALAGYNMGNTKLGLDVLTFNDDETREWRNLGRVDGFGGEGWDGTLQIGGDIEVRGIVAGAFAEYSFGGTESEVSIFEGLGQLNVEQQDSYCLMGRLGVARGDTLFYGASGWCHTEFEATLHIGDESGKQSFEFDGVPLEVGVEHRFTPNVRGRLAGRYTWYGEETILGGGEEDGARLTAEPGLFAIKAGIVITTGGAIDPLR